MAKPPDGGPAFPVLHTIDGNWVKEPVPALSGMTLRQYYAGQALVGVLSEEWNNADGSLIKGLAEYAKLAVALADALIAELGDG